MKEKHQKLLKRLNGPKYQTGEALADFMEVSSKTVRLMIQELNEELEGAVIVSRRRVGYRLEISDWERFEHFLKKAQKRRLPATPQERVAYILEMLLKKRQFVKLDDLSEQLYISKKTLSRELKEVEERLTAYGLRLVRRPGYGIAAEGSEFNIRLCLADDGRRAEKASGEMQKQIRDCVLDCLKEHSLTASDAALRSLTLHLEIAIQRIRQGCFLDGAEKGELFGEGQEEYRAADWLAKQLEKQYDMVFPPSEISYIALHLAGKQGLRAGENDNVVIDSSTSGLAVRMLELVKSAFAYDFLEDLELRMALSQHLLPLRVRLSHHLSMKNPLLKEIREKYPLAYAMAAHAVIAVEQEYGGRMADDEIGYIALLFALALERRQTEIAKKNILLVCASGHGTAELLKYKYQQEFGRYLQRVETCDVNQLEAMDFDCFDYVFTTVPIRIPVPIPIEEVGSFLEEGDIRRIRQVLGPKKGNRIRGYYPESLFFPSLRADTREEVLRLMCGRMIESCGLAPEFYESVCKREQLAQTAFGNLVALPHSYEAMSDRTYACVAVLKEPVLWDGQPVQAVFLLSIEKKKHKELQHFFQVTMQFLSDRAKVQGLIRRRDYAWLMEMLEKIEDEIIEEDQKK